MLLTPEQLQEVRDIIAKHHSAYIVNMISEDAVPPEVLAELKEKGLVDVEANSIRESYLYGQLLGQLQNNAAANMSYAQFKQYIRKNPIPLSDIEQHAIEMAEQSAGQYCRGLGNRIDTQTGALLIEADQQLRAKWEAEIRTLTSRNIAKRETIGQLKSDLGWASKDWARDFKRIALTEKQTAMQQGVADHYRERYGPDVEVFKRPMPDACQHCKRVHLGPDGQPRIYKLSVLEDNGTNVGKKAKDWLAVVGTVHPNCQCQMNRVPPGWGFNDEGDLVPGGELGQRYESTEELALALVEELDLWKAFQLQGRMVFQGIPIAIENKDGSERRWTAPDGSTGTTRMWGVHYGYVEGTQGADDDEIDCFIGPDPRAEIVYVVHQQTPETGIYDETKCFLGFASAKEAKAAYDRHYDSPDFFGWMEAMSIDAFKRWVSQTRPQLGESLESAPLNLAKGSVKSNGRDSVFGGEFLDRCAFFVKGKRFISWEQAARAVVLGRSNGRQSTAMKRFPDSRLVRSKASSNFSDAVTGVPKSEGFIQIPGPWSPMFAPVFSGRNQFQIGGVVVKSIPIAVMDEFGGAEWATKNRLHNDPMLKSLASVFPDKPILCLGIGELTDMATLKASSHKADNTHGVHKNQGPHHVIPLEKSGKLDPSIAMANQPERGPGPGLGINYFITVPRGGKKNTIQKEGYTPTVKELVDDKETWEVGTFYVDKEVYEILEQFDKVFPYVIPAEWQDLQEGARSEKDKTMDWVKRESARNVIEPKNTADVEDISAKKPKRTPMRKTDD